MPIVETQKKMPKMRTLLSSKIVYGKEYDRQGCHVPFMEIAKFCHEK